MVLSTDRAFISRASSPGDKVVAVEYGNTIFLDPPTVSVECTIRATKKSSGSGTGISVPLTPGGPWQETRTVFELLSRFGIAVLFRSCWLEGDGGPSCAALDTSSDVSSAAFSFCS